MKRKRDVFWFFAGFITFLTLQDMTLKSEIETSSSAKKEVASLEKIIELTKELSGKIDATTQNSASKEMRDKKVDAGQKLEGARAEMNASTIDEENITPSPPETNKIKIVVPKHLSKGMNNFKKEIDFSAMLPAELNRTLVLPR